MKKTLIIVMLLSLVILSIFMFLKYKNHTTSYIYNLSILDKQSIVDNLLSEENKKNYSCNNPFIKLNPYGNSPLSAILIFNSEKDVKVSVLGKNDDTTIENNYSGGSYIIPIIGLYPDYDNKILIECGEFKKVLIVKTDKLPDGFPDSKIIKNEYSFKNNLLFTTPSPSGVYPVAYDSNGDVRWYLNQKHVVTSIKLLKNGNIMIGSNRLLSPIYNMSGLYEMSLTGKIYNEFIYENGFHHDFIEMEDGNILLLSNNFENNTEEDLVVLMNREDGSIIKKFELNKILDMESGKQQNWTERSWLHANSISYDSTDNSLTISGRHQDLIINIDFETGNLNWLLGDPTNATERMLPYFLKPKEKNFKWHYAQHSVTKEGNLIYLFDNGNNRSKIAKDYIKPNDNYSRALIYKLDDQKKGFEQIFSFGEEFGSEAFSPYISSFLKINSTDFLVNFGGIYEFFGQKLNAPAFVIKAKNRKAKIIILKDGLEKFEFQIKENIYQARLIAINNNQLKLEEGKPIGDFRTKTDSVFEIDFNDFRNGKETRYDFKLVIEKDRLQFITKIFTKSEVSFILKNKKETKFFNQFVSNRFSKYNYTNLSVKNLDSVYDVYVFIDNNLYLIKKDLQIK